MRLCTELLYSYEWLNDDDRSRAQAEEQRGLVYCLTAGSRSQDQPSFASSLLWADRCGLPLVLDVDNTRDDVLALLPERLRGRVATLCVKVRVRKRLLSFFESLIMRKTTFLEALPTFPHVQELCIQSENNEGGLTDITEALRAAAGLPISKIVVRDFRSLRDFSALAGAQHLRSISARQCAIASMEGLASCPELTDVDVSNNPTLEGLTSLTGALGIETLNATWCNLGRLEGLSSCTALRAVNVSENENLTSLVGLAGLPCLEKVVAQDCWLTTLHGLRSCPSLTDVDVSDNDLSDISDIAGAQHLTRLKVAGCDPRCLFILSTLPVLTELNISYVSGVGDLRMLAGAACLETLVAQECGLLSVEGLDQCPRLRTLDVSHNDALQSLAGLAGAPLLETINAQECDLMNIDGLNSCPKLKDVDASYNKSLTNLGGLAGAPCLEEVVVQGCSVMNTLVLDPSVRVITDEN
ncbi:Leucine Rich repeat [Lotmaria passim]